MKLYQHVDPIHIEVGDEVYIQGIGWVSLTPHSLAEVRDKNYAARRESKQLYQEPCAPAAVLPATEHHRTVEDCKKYHVVNGQEFLAIIDDLKEQLRISRNKFAALTQNHENFMEKYHATEESCADLHTRLSLAERNLAFREKESEARRMTLVELWEVVLGSVPDLPVPDLHERLIGAVRDLKKKK